jgi:hypothetical protein
LKRAEDGAKERECLSHVGYSSTPYLRSFSHRRISFRDTPPCCRRQLVAQNLCSRAMLVRPYTMEERAAESMRAPLLPSRMVRDGRRGGVSPRTAAQRAARRRFPFPF